MKVAIIGAGACGLYLGWKLSEKGHQITIFEKSQTIGKKACSGLFSERIFDFVPKSKKLVKNEINSALINFPKKTIKISFSKKFVVINRSKLDLLLAGLARKAGVKIILNHNVSELPNNFTRIIGCDGADSFIREYLKLKRPGLRLGIQGFIKKNSRKKFVETWPCKNGLLWQISRGDEIEYGIMSDFKNAYRIFIAFLKKFEVNLKDVKTRIIPQGLIVPDNPSINSGQVQITLCGDAAGLTKPWSGGGVIWGFKAAELLLESFPDFQVYSKKVKRFFIPKIITSKILIKLVYFFGFYLPWFLPKNKKIESDFLF